MGSHNHCIMIITLICYTNISYYGHVLFLIITLSLSLKKKNNICSIALFHKNYEMINILNDLSLWNTNKDRKYFDDATNLKQQFDKKKQDKENENDGLYLVCLDHNYILY